LQARNATLKLSPENLIGWIKEHSPWICRANGLRLAVQLTQDNATVRTNASAASSELVSAFEQAVVHAEVRRRRAACLLGGEAETNVTALGAAWPRCQHSYHRYD